MAPAATAEIAVRTACLRGVPPRNFRNTTGRPRRPAVGWRRAATWTSTWIASRGFRASAAVESYTFVSSWRISESKCQGCSFAKSSSQYIYIYILYIYSIYLYSVYIYIYIVFIRNCGKTTVFDANQFQVLGAEPGSTPTSRAGRVSSRYQQSIDQHIYQNITPYNITSLMVSWRDHHPGIYSVW